MSILDIFKSKKDKLKYAKMLTGSIPIFSQFGNDIYTSDVVRQSIRCIAQECKKLEPLHIIKKGSDLTPIYDEIQLILENPNDLMTTSDFIEKIVWTLYLNYNCFIVPVYENGKLISLFPLNPTNVEFLEDERNIMYCKFSFSNGYKSTVRYSDIIHIRYEYSINEFMGGGRDGKPDHAALLQTLELNNTLLTGVSKALKSSFAINGIVKYNSLLDDGKLNDALNDLTRRLQSNESGFMPLDLKSEFIPFNRNIQLVDSTTLKFIDEKILRNFGVSLPILIGDYTKEQYEAFFQKTLEPLIKTISQAFTKCLFSKRENFGFGHKIIFYPKDLIFLNTTQKLEMIRLLGDSGGLFENEKRVLMGLKPLKELENKRYMSLNYVDVQIASEYQLEKIQSPNKYNNVESDLNE